VNGELSTVNLCFANDLLSISKTAHFKFVFPLLIACYFVFAYSFSWQLKAAFLSLPLCLVFVKLCNKPFTMTQRELHYMQAAIDLAREGMQNGVGGPFGCVIVKDNTIVGRGCNSVSSSNDPTAHAEVVAIRDACKRLQTFQLTDCEIYTSCEPCPMCMGAIYWARPKVVYYGATRHDAAAAGFDDSLIYQELAAPYQERIIGMINLGGDHAVKIFAEWNDKDDKVAY
jgi:guanine deaminase